MCKKKEEKAYIHPSKVSYLRICCLQIFTHYWAMAALCSIFVMVKVLASSIDNKKCGQLSKTDPFSS